MPLDVTTDLFYTVGEDMPAVSKEFHTPWNTHCPTPELEPHRVVTRSRIGCSPSKPVSLFQNHTTPRAPSNGVRRICLASIPYFKPSPKCSKRRTRIRTTFRKQNKHPGSKPRTGILTTVRGSPISTIQCNTSQSTTSLTPRTSTYMSLSMTSYLENDLKISSSKAKTSALTPDDAFIPSPKLMPHKRRQSMPIGMEKMALLNAFKMKLTFKN